MIFILIFNSQMFYLKAESVRYCGILVLCVRYCSRPQAALRHAPPRA